MNDIKTPDIVQLTCPYCKKEFPFNSGDLDKEYEAAKREFIELSREITILKNQPYSVRKMNEGKIKVLGQKVQDAQFRCTAIKKARKLKDQQLNHYKMIIYREIVKDLIGEDAEKKVLEEAVKELEAYKVSGLMRHEYTRSNAKPSVTSTNKL